MFKEIIATLLIVAVAVSNSLQIIQDTPTCGTCVSNLADSFSAIQNIVVTNTSVNSCQNLCPLLGDYYSASCSLTCLAFGYTSFTNYIVYDTPDPIYVCQYAELCATNSNPTALITNFTTTPAYAPVGTDIQVTMQYTVTVGTGQSQIIIAGPSGNTFLQYERLLHQISGKDTISFLLSTLGDVPGVYSITGLVCAETCFSTAPGAATLSKSYYSYQLN
ncbi:hypothetical protein DFA_08182 [Cavenderia fasciculata]|uniref:Countin-like protein n=1 Tax=Cavenderia fasciculata TaxID=261658 RepID=F4Q5D6_CACFS|nr:uncharacterized protein DFA_08182 [Cavenderia fasciculata]EGG17195.1 hypothetical protein DFA_08182 [Cavenderia fasciculata]|eukprot:XP_004355679.1 hypothetical protein DFA_08182 [Cavenderia fasciculata]